MDTESAHISSGYSRYKASFMPLLPVILSVAAVVIGFTALIIGLSATGGGATSDKALSQKVAALEQKLSLSEAQLAENYSKSYAQMNAMATQMQNALTEVSQEMQAMRQTMKSYETGIQQIANKAVTGAPSSVSKTAQPQPSSNASAFNTYRIQPGDTFTKIAKLKGVSVDLLIQENPQANPARLQIGQSIKVPAAAR